MTRRSLSPDDRALWERVRSSVRPIRKRRRHEAGEEAGHAGTAPAAEAKETTEAAAATPEKTPPPAARPRPARAGPLPPPAPPLSPLEPKERRRLGRGAAEPDARLDLHGMRQTAAFHALAAFLRGAQGRGARTVLVITGKGRAADQEAGVLRQAVPRWLAEPQFRDLVVGFEPAARRHGGEGAFYVRLRRRRG